MNWEAFWLTVRLAAIVSTLLIAIGIPIAYWLTYSRWRWKFLVEAAVALPIVLPPTVLGFYVLVALGSRSPLGRWWESLTGHTLAFTFEGLVIGSLLYSLPFAVQPFAASFGAVDSNLLRASASLGHSPLQTFRRIVLPLSKAGLVTGFALSFAHTLGEFGVVLMVGGNIPGVTRTISIDIYDQVQTANYSSANQTALAPADRFLPSIVDRLRLEPAAVDGGSMAVKAKAQASAIVFPIVTTCAASFDQPISAELEVRIRKRFPNPEGTFNLNVHFRALAGFTILFGASGAGKTTLLDCIAGLSDPDEGRIAVGGEDLYDSEKKRNVAAWKRRIGYVHQDLALFPHLTAEENVAYGLRSLSVTERTTRSREILARFRHRSLCATGDRRKSPEASANVSPWRAPW